MLCCSKDSTRSSDSVPVYLNVYDLDPINRYAYWVGLGFYHSGVEVHGVEYAFGPGIFELVKAKVCNGLSIRKSILMGWTELSLIEVRQAMKELGEEYKHDAYDILTKNCNHFSNDACRKITSKSIPCWVNRLAKIGQCCSCILPPRPNSPKVGPQDWDEDKLCDEDEDEDENENEKKKNDTRSKG